MFLVTREETSSRYIWSADPDSLFVFDYLLNMATLFRKTKKRDEKNAFTKSLNDLVDNCNFVILPKEVAILELFRRSNIRLSRINSELDSYFAAESKLRENLSKFSKQWSSTCHRFEADCQSERIWIRLDENQSMFYKLLDLRLEKDKQEQARDFTKRKNVSFGETTVSTFTTSSEEAPKTPTLTNTLATDNGVNLVSSNSNSQQSEPPNSKTVPKVSESSKSSLEEDFDQKEKEKMLRLQRIEQRQERAKKGRNSAEETSISI